MWLSKMLILWSKLLWSNCNFRFWTTWFYFDHIACLYSSMTQNFHTLYRNFHRVFIIFCDSKPAYWLHRLKGIVQLGDFFFQTIEHIVSPENWRISSDRIYMYIVYSYTGKLLTNSRREEGILWYPSTLFFSAIETLSWDYFPVFMKWALKQVYNYFILASGHCLVNINKIIASDWDHNEAHWPALNR